MLLLTIGILFVLFIVSYTVFDKDILSPSAVVSVSLMFGCFCAFYNEEKWAIDFSFTTTAVISVGVISFIIGGIIAVTIAGAFSKSQTVFSHTISSVDSIEIEKVKTFIIVGVQLAIMVILFAEERRITGGSNWITVVAKWRLLTGRNANLEDTTIRLSKLLRQFLQVNLAFGFIYVYIVGNNFATRKKQSIINWIPIILCIVITFMQGYRGDMLRMWVMMLIISFNLRKRTVGWKNNQETKKMVQKMGLSVIAIAVLFVIFRGTVGRTSDKDPISYVTFYAGCPIAAFNEFLKYPLDPSNIWGKETFYDLNQSISAFFNRPELRYIFYKEFIQSPNGTLIGNVYTAFRPPYYDFGGIGGMIIYMILSGFFSHFYIARYVINVERIQSIFDYCCMHTYRTHTLCISIIYITALLLICS